MSRTHPIGLRTSSKQLNPSFVGVGQYYSYNQLKYNIVIRKSIKQLSKLLAIPAYRIADRFHSEKKNTKNVILYPSLLPISVQLKAKQLFDSQYVLNRRRLYSAAIYITRLLRQQFEKNYNGFTENTYSNPLSNDAKYTPYALNLPIANPSKCQKWEPTKLKFRSKYPSITFAREFFRVSQNPFSSFCDIKKSSTLNRTINKREKGAKQLKQAKQSEKTLGFLLPTTNSDPYLILSYGVPFFGRLQRSIVPLQKLKEFYFLIKKAKEKDQECANLHSPVIVSPNVQSKKNPLTTVHKKRTQNGAFSKPRGLGELYHKPAMGFQTTKRFILLHYLGQLRKNKALYQKLKFKQNHRPTHGVPLPLAKEAENKQKRLYINSVPVNKEDILTNLSARKVSYAFCPRSNVAILNLNNIKKLTKQIEHFRSDIKLLAPLGLLFHRSFSEPVGIHCISAVDNRLEKTYCNPFLSNLLFKRTSDNFLKSSYMNSQRGLLRVRNTLLFDFAYTKDSLTKLGLKKTNTLMQQQLETGRTKLWLRKLSSIRL